MSVFNLLIQTDHIVISLLYHLLRPFINLNLKNEDHLQEPIEIIKLGLFALLDANSKMDIFAIIDKILHKVIAAVMNSPVQLMVETLYDLEELRQLPVENAGQLQVDTLKTVLRAVLDQFTQHVRVQLKHPDIHFRLDHVELRVLLDKFLD